MQRYGRTPGPITEVYSGGLTATSIGIAFMAPGTDGTIPPPVRGYLVKQSRKPIRTWGEFQKAQTLCGGDCAFNVVHVGDFVSLEVTNLKPYTPYYYAIAPRDNVSLRCGQTAFAAATPGDLNMPGGPGMHTVVNPSPLGFHPAPPCARSSWVVP